jgi:hypothetical protein
VTFLPADPVVSGKPYPVREVSGQAPSALDDFVGQATLVIEDGREAGRLVTGMGARSGDVVRFREKDADGSKDVRVWRITGSSSEGFVAQHDAVY